MIKLRPEQLLYKETKTKDVDIQDNEDLINSRSLWKTRALKCYAHVDAFIQWYDDGTQTEAH